MINGRISIASDSSAIDKIKPKVLLLNFENESIVFHDTGKIGTVIRYKPALGRTPDAFGDNFTLAYFFKIANRKPTTNVKAFLIDQKVVKGIGNAYADEILWLARVSPKSVIGAIPNDVMVKLYETIGTVLHNAVVSIKAISPDIISGEERSFLKIHNKSIWQTETGHLIIVETIASKTTYFTDEQILYR